MRFNSPKSVIIATILLVLLGGGMFVLFYFLQGDYVPREQSDKEPVELLPKGTTAPQNKNVKTIGYSVEGRKIQAYPYGSGATRLLFVGGIHGGYEWNSVYLAYKFIDYLNANPKAVPAYLTVVVVPSANPDGVYKATGKEGRFLLADVSKDAELLASARFNAHEVDLNRNFDCEWQPESTWRGKVVSAGTSAFSEPEAAAIRNFVQANTFESVIFWHSQANTVYASHCDGITLPGTINIMNVYAKAAGYNAVETFDGYDVTGDSEGWLAKIGIPAITVELKTHETVEWEQNLLGIKALFAYYAPK